MLSEELDDRYLELLDLNDGIPEAEGETQRTIAEARAAKAHEKTLKGAPIEAIYEAGMAVENWNEIRDFIGSLLDA